MLKYYNNKSLNDIPELVYSEADESYITPKGYKFVVLNIFGRASVVLLPEKVKSSGPSSPSYKCPCNGVEGKCKLKNKLIVKYCDKDESSPSSEACNVIQIIDENKGETFSYKYFDL